MSKAVSSKNGFITVRRTLAFLDQIKGSRILKTNSGISVHTEETIC